MSKLYRIGQAREVQDSVSATALAFLRRPLSNFRKYRSLYRLDDVDMDSARSADDVLWSLRDASFEVDRGEVVGISAVMARVNRDASRGTPEAAARERAGLSR